MKTRIFILLLSIFIANSVLCLAQDATNRLISENDFEKITFHEKVTIGELKAQNQSWTLLRKRLGPPVRVEEKDEFVEQTKTFYYNGAKFQYSDAGDSGNFTLSNISITKPEFYISIHDQSLRVSDPMEDAMQFEHSINESESVLSIKVFTTDTAGNYRYHESGERLRSESEYLSVKFDPFTKKITEINFMWRII